MRSRGIALVITLAVLLMVGLLVFGAFFTTQIERWVSRNDVTATQAQYVADAGLDKYKTALFQYFRWLQEPGNDSTAAPTRTACFNRLGAGLDLNRTGSPISWNNGRITYPSEVLTDADGNVLGNYTVTIYKDPDDSNLYTLEAVGTSSGARSTVRATFRIELTGALQQAVFTGQGQSNKFINGGATIRGGIYVVGSDPNATVIDSNGNFTMLNRYDLTDSSRYPSNVANRVHPNNRSANNLCANLRVQYGKVSVGGSTQIGEETNRVVGVWVGRGASDVNNGGSFNCQQTKGICTDVGPAAFDLSNPPAFPTFDGPGVCQIPSNGNPTWRQCIRYVASLPGQGLFISRTGSVPVVQWPSAALPSAIPGSCYNAVAAAAASSDKKLVLDSVPVDCSYTMPDGSRGGFKYTPNPAKLEVYGTVNLKGFSLRLARDADYQARTALLGATPLVERQNASLVVEKLDSSDTLGGNLDLDGSLLPDAAGGNAYFPNHVLAVIAEGDTYQRGQYVMAPVYSGGTFRIVKDNVLLGSVISNMFCTTSAGNQASCNAGQKSEVVYINTAENVPAALRPIQYRGPATFKLLSYERR
ncbi:MAG: pilus assembly PilX family protein [Deinococcota bacterium]